MLDCDSSGYRFKSYYLPIINLNPNKFYSNKYLVLKKTLTKNYNANSVTNIFYINTVFLFNFLFNFKNSKIIIQNKLISKLDLINFIYIINLQNRQPKINIIDIWNHTFFNFSIGLLLKTLNNFNKHKRRSILMLKHLVIFLLSNFKKKFKKKIFFLIRGLKQNFMKILYFFKFLFKKYDITIFFVDPLKSFKQTKLKLVRSLKRRIYKKIIKSNLLLK